MEPTKAAVSIFFISSGFLLSMKHPIERVSWAGWKHFVAGHALKIYPLQWLGLVALLVFQTIFIVPELDWWLLAHVALIQSWVPIRDVYFGYNGHSWFLASLMFCYVAYPLLSTLWHRVRLRWQCLAMAVVTAVFWWRLSGTEPSTREFLYVYPLIRIWDFVLGMVLHKLYQAAARTGFSPGRWKATLIEAAMVLFFLELIIINQGAEYTHPYEDFLLWWAPMGILVFGSAMLNGHEGYIGRMLLWWPLQWLGGLGFEIYIFQSIAALSFNYMVAPFFGHFGIILYGDYAWGMIPILIMLAWAVNRGFTRPLNAWLRRHRPAA